MISQAEVLLNMFRDAMLDKLKLRAAKHPDDNFLTMSLEDMAKYPLDSITEHMNLEMVELFTARGFGGHAAARKEAVDVANMALIEWALRYARDTKNVK